MVFVSNFAAALAWNDGDWTSAELDLDEVETIEDLADLAQQVEPGGDFVIVLIEDEDWFAVARVAADGSTETFVSDAAEAFRSPIGEVLVTETGADVVASDDDPEGFAVPSAPVGEAGLLTDLGLKSGDLTRLASSGVTPADAVTEIAERIDAIDALEELR